MEKKFASSFFGTDLAGYLKGLGVDTVIMTGCTTSGCIRASAIDSLQWSDVVYTTIAYEPDFRDAGLFIKKVPSLSILLKGSPMVEVDRRIAPLPGERVVEKKFASSFFGTDLAGYLKGLGVDTVIMTGCTTSGCVRASAIDSLQYGFLTVVVREGVGDRPEGTHEANLLDIDAKYGDVVSPRGFY